MNISFNTHLKGTYIIQDQYRNEICRSDNIVTDAGMARLVGDPSIPVFSTGYTSSQPNHFTRAFVHNLSALFIGSGSNAASRTDFQLQTPITTGFTSVNDPGATGTTFTTDGNNNLIITFTKSNQYNFTSSATIRELGCHWKTTFANTLADGIFSRATVSPVSVNNGDILYISYELSISTNLNQVIESLPFNTISPAVSLPPSKTNLRRFPFYRLQNNGTPENTWGRSASNPFNPTPPFLEDFGFLYGPSIWRLYQPSINGTTNPSSPSYPSYSAMTSTTTNNFDNGGTVGWNLYNEYDLAPIRTLFISQPTNNFWQKKLQFVFTPSLWRPILTWLSLQRSGDGEYFTGGSMNDDEPQILTTFNQSYNPYANNPNIYVGFEYTFNFTRT